MLEPDVAREWPEQWNALSEKHWDARYDHALNESGRQESLHRYSAVDVEAFQTALRKPSDDLLRGA